MELLKSLYSPTSPMCLVLDIKRERLLCITSLSIVHKNLGQGSLCPQRRPEAFLFIIYLCYSKTKVNVPNKRKLLLAIKHACLSVTLRDLDLLV
ncbi:hypothetical protein VIGAN_10099000 [Vigna angularis var. angularis]|uniref:Uncharacterized protein n=1 Tax=Vigna angularis var. angularis TaxID=157739 RepID=A0A0S3T3V7_PHAAN|nr:hypothetical protein VIGAN_10099000 [Vigna angularis var. angularis]